MPAPEMIAGMRQPRVARLEDAALRAAAGVPHAEPVLPATPEGVTVYVSRFANYRIQVTSPQSFINPATGQLMPTAPEIVALFEGQRGGPGIYRNNHRDPEIRALIDRTLQSNPYFGSFASKSDKVHFWLLSEQRDAVESGRVKAAMETLKALPREQVEAFVAQLSQGEDVDVKMPAPTAAPGTAAPAPSGARPIKG